MTELLDNATGQAPALRRGTLELDRRVGDASTHLRLSVRSGREGDGSVVVIEDVTQLRAAEDARANFIAHATHELRTPLTNMRSALELYYAEHNNTYPAAADFANALVNQYTDVDGNLNATKTGVFIYGPYLKEVPTIQVGAQKGNSGVAAADAAGVAWLYNETTGVITANTGTTTDDTGTLYTTY